MKGKVLPHLKLLLVKLLMCLALVIPLWLLIGTASHSAEGDIIEVTSIPGYSVYIDGSNNICIETYDRERASTIYYKTLAFTISRCAPGEARLINGIDSEYVDLGLYETLRTSQRIRCKGKIYIQNIFRIPMEKLIAQIRRAGADHPSYLDWITEIENYYYHKSTEVCYLKFDCIMTTVNEGKIPKVEGEIFDGSYHFDSWGKVYFNRPIDNGANPTAIQNAYGWRDKSGLVSHFNRYLSLGETDVTPSEPVIGDVPVALYETKNYSSGFDISTAIPSGEQVTNVISAAAFTGNDLDIRTDTVTNAGYSATYNYVMRETTYDVERVFLRRIDAIHMTRADMMFLSSCMKNPDRYDVVNSYRNIWDVYVKRKKETVTERTVATKTFRFKASMAYQYLGSAPKMYAFDSMTVRNQAFPGGEILDRKLTYTAAEVGAPTIKMTMFLFSNEAVKTGAPYVTLREGISVKDRDYAPAGSGYHYEFASSFDYPYHTYTTYITNTSQLNEAIRKDRLTEAGKIADNCWSRNDGIIINDGENSFSLMKSDEVKGAVITDADTGVVILSRDTAATSAKAYGVEYTMAKINKDLLARRVAGMKTVEIPMETDNADFPTSCECTWKSIFTDPEDNLTLYAGKNIYSGTGVDDIYEHVMDGGKGPNHKEGDMYPIRVHTPVISPIKIVTSDGSDAVEKTQLIKGHSYNPSVDNQLLLDRTYFISWENQTWLSALYGEVEGYSDVLDKYTKAKWMRFPFTVVYNNTLYERDEESGYTDWIEVLKPDDYETPYDEGVDVGAYQSANHWQMTPFYIPSFAEEGGEPGEEIFVECKVEAWNVLGRDLGNHTSAVQLTGNMNSSKECYVASARKYLQLSGWIYDFSVVGSNNQTLYNGEGLLDDDVYVVRGDISFADKKAEKKTGTLNRLGLPNIRYLTDGSLTDAWDKLNTIPLRNGQSWSFSDMGNVWRGQVFAFTIKTISNLSGENDSVQITPTFTYVKKNGEVLSSENEDFQIVILQNGSYYRYNPNDHSLSYRSYEMSLNDGKLKESYYDTKDSNAYQFGDWLTSSVKNENTYRTDFPITNQSYFYRKTTTSNLSHISIPSTLRYVSGEYEQLGWNQDRQYIRGGLSNLYTYEGIRGYGDSQEWDFITSMQQWQSAYWIPEEIRIIDTREREDFDLIKYIEEKGGISYNDEIFEKLDGYLVINFDIIAYKDGEPYLEYSGGYEGARDMWETEGYEEGTIPGDPDDGPDIPIKEGDVAIVELGRRMRDWYEPAIHNIN